jgi:serine protease
MKPLLTLALAACASAQVTLPVEWDTMRPVTSDWASTGDPLRPQQWGLDAIGPMPPLTRPPVAIAVCDTGAGVWHEDLPTTDLFSMFDPGGLDDVGHGTHVMTTAAARTGNGLGITGATDCPDWPLISVKALYQGWGDVPRVAASIVIAATAVTSAGERAGVVNCSLQGPNGPEMRVAAQWCEDRGVIVVFAAGNSWGGPVSELASDQYFIVVSSIDPSLGLSDFSSVGERVDFCAPGRDVLAAWPLVDKFSGVQCSDCYIAISGTSMAAPHVTGVIARMLSERPLSREQAYTALRYTAIDLGPPGWDRWYGHGLVQASAVDLVRADRTDVDRSGVRDHFDLLAFQTAFLAREPAADFDLDGTFTIFDFLEFAGEFGL